MKKILLYFNFILQIIFFISLFNIANSKNLDKYFNEDDLSDYLSGILSLSDNNYPDSYKYLKSLEGLESSHLDYSKSYQLSLINSQKFNEAYNFSKKLQDKGLDNFESNLLIGVYYLKANNREKARKYFKKLDSKTGNNPLLKLLSLSANNWMKFDKIDENNAIELLNKTSPRFEEINKIQKSLAYCFYDSDKTERNFETLVSDKEIDFSRYIFFQVNYLKSKKKIKLANNILSKAIDDYPRNLILNQLNLDLNLEKTNDFNDKFNCKNVSHIFSEIFYIVANAFSAQSNYLLSNFYLNLSKYLNPDFTSFDTLYAENFYQIKNYEQSKKIYNKIKKKGKFYNWYASKQISNILFKQTKELDSLENLSNSFLKIKSPTISEMYDYAEFLKNNKKYKQAINYYNKSINLIDKQHYLYPKLTHGRGVALERIGKWAQAETDFLNSLKSSPDQAYVMNYLAYTWIEKGVNIEKSLQMLKKANEIKKNDGYIIDSLGWALFKLKKYKEAKEYLQKAVRMMPSDPIVNDHFGDTLWMNKQFIQARYYWNYVLNLEDAEQDLKSKIKVKINYGLKH
jgi:tetratricopeptide (TPR) repeat protein